MGNFVLTEPELVILKELAEHGPRSIELLPSQDYQGLLNQGLAEKMVGEEGEDSGKIILSPEGVEYYESITPKKEENEEDVVEEQTEEQTEADQQMAKEAMRIAVECARLDTQYVVSTEGISELLKNSMGGIVNGFKSFINSIKPNGPALNIDDNRDDIDNSLLKVPYLNVSQIPMMVPEGLNVKYLVYINSLDVAVERSGNVNKLIDDFTREVAAILTNQDMRLDTTSHDAKWREMDSAREAAYATVGACFNGTNRAKLGYSKLVDRNKDWGDVCARAKILCDKMNNINRPKLVKSAKHLYDLLKKVEDLSKHGGFDGMSPEVVRSLAEGSYQIACELEFYAVTYYRVETLSKVLSENFKVLKKITKIDLT